MPSESPRPLPGQAGLGPESGGPGSCFSGGGPLSPASAPPLALNRGPHGAASGSRPGLESLLRDSPPGSEGLEGTGLSRAQPPPRQEPVRMATSRGQCDTKARDADRAQHSTGTRSIDGSWLSLRPVRGCLWVGQRGARAPLSLEASTAGEGPRGRGHGQAWPATLLAGRRTWEDGRCAARWRPVPALFPSVPGLRTLSGSSGKLPRDRPARGSRLLRRPMGGQDRRCHTTMSPPGP